MVSNFDFLKTKDKKLYDIMIDAERLYCDGYFEQTIGQVRKFGEIVSKNVLGVRRTTEESFSDILATLSDILGDNQADREFIDDLYFIKQKGNLAVHESAREQGGVEALECLQRAYEVSICYALKNGWGNKKLLNSTYNVNKLMTGKEEKLSDKYEKKKEELIQDNKIEVIKEKKEKKTKKTSKKTLNKKEKPKKEKKINEDINQNKTELYTHLIIGIILISMMIGILIFILPL